RTAVVATRLLLVVAVRRLSRRKALAFGVTDVSDQVPPVSTRSSFGGIVNGESDPSVVSMTASTLSSGELQLPFDPSETFGMSVTTSLGLLGASGPARTWVATAVASTRIGKREIRIVVSSFRDGRASLAGYSTPRAIRPWGGLRWSIPAAAGCAMIRPRAHVARTRHPVDRRTRRGDLESLQGALSRGRDHEARRG